MSLRRLLTAFRSPALIVSMVALIVAVGGSAVAAGSATGHAAKAKKKPRLTLNSTDKKFINSLIASGHVAFATSATTAATATTATSATSAATATSATNATNAGSAGNATNLGGQPSAAYLLTGTSGEAWHLVGAAGQPAFQNGWTNFGGGFAPAGFYVDPIGIAHLKGVIAGGTADTLAFILPSGYRPPASLAFAVAAGTPGPTLENVDVLSDGEVLTNGTATTAVALDGISFRVS